MKATVLLLAVAILLTGGACGERRLTREKKNYMPDANICSYEESEIARISKCYFSHLPSHTSVENDVVIEPGRSDIDEAAVAGTVVAILFALLAAVGFFYCRLKRDKCSSVSSTMAFCGRLMKTGIPDSGARDERASFAGGDSDYVSYKNVSPQEPLLSSAFQLDREIKAKLEAENLYIKKENVIICAVIGQGQFGCVYRGILDLGGKNKAHTLAVKTLQNNTLGGEADAQEFLREALIMKDFHHMNVLPLIGLSVDEAGGLMVITPYMKHGDLLSYVRDPRNNPTVRDLLGFGIHVAEGMRYLADLKFVHRDLAARNCMLSEDMIVRVADFGLSRDVYEQDYYSEDRMKKKLPVRWMAPESLEKGVYNHKTDVWSYGVLLWELLTRGVTPYPDVPNWDIVKFLKQGRRLEQPSFCPSEIYTVMLKCWQDDTNRRPSFARLANLITDIISSLVKGKGNVRVGLNITYGNCLQPEAAACAE
ncbi:hepatocyte growth factor receptor-like [Dermacentor andersoni]|uniref:hepatocyte growth factor receptor-like n=1 Tax=Dermacentor andersoni TaxID=34620 RepID=UPI002155528F|nr:hepatocyte growth factor receptor-like [Dermacentor andersoni]XP_054922462.1 hepatocyte growth factor receptor-like [Dermacentor andersoni]XP_054922463.1 hepatocyte growth factor receptor-like [Dermacentor andersoni]